MEILRHVLCFEGNSSVVTFWSLFLLQCPGLIGTKNSSS
ncbi:hypothetical protein AAZX31_02G260400 [Glycine max]